MTRSLIQTAELFAHLEGHPYTKTIRTTTFLRFFNAEFLVYTLLYTQEVSGSSD